MQEGVVVDRPGRPLEAPPRPLAVCRRLRPRRLDGARPAIRHAIQPAPQALQAQQKPGHPGAGGVARCPRPPGVALARETAREFGKRPARLLGRRHLAHQLQFHLGLPSSSQAAAQAAERLAGAAGAGPIERFAPQAEGGPEPPGGHAHVVDRLVVLLAPGAPERLAELGEPATVVGAEARRQRIGEGEGPGPEIRPPAVHGRRYSAASRVEPFPGEGAGRGRRRISMTRRHRRSEMAGTSSPPSKVSKPYSSASVSSWRITRSW